MFACFTFVGLVAIWRVKVVAPPLIAIAKERNRRPSIHLEGGADATVAPMQDLDMKKLSFVEDHYKNPIPFAGPTSAGPPPPAGLDVGSGRGISE